MTRHLKTALFAAALLLGAQPSFAATTVLDQIPAPVPSATNSQYLSELLTQSQAVAGGTLYTSILQQPGASGRIIGIADAFVPTSATSPLRFLALTNGKSDLGVPMTAAAGTPSGTMGVARTAGTSLTLVGEATSSSAKTDKVIFETNLADSYQAGAAVPIVVNTNYTTSGTVTTASTTMNVAAYSEVNGVETALVVTAPASNLIPLTATNLTYSLAGTGLLPGSHIVVELTMLVTTSAGAATGQLNSVALQE